MILDKILSTLLEAPSFQTAFIRDRNVLSGHHKTRKISMPNEAMLELHRYLLRELRFQVAIRGSGLPLSRYSSAGERSDSAVVNALRHRSSRFYYLLDIESAFPSTNGELLIELLLEHLLDEKEPEAFANAFREYFLDENGGLVVGAPASTLLFNLFCYFRIDQDIARLCGSYGLLYSRYIDDFTLSHPDQKIGKGLRRTVRQVVEKEGFSVSHRKSEVLDRQKGPVTITGVGIQPNGRLFVSRDFTRRVSGLMHWLTNHPGRGAEFIIARNRLHGMMGVIRYVAKRSQTSFNRTERKILVRYRQLQRRLS
ncbi:MAG: reverse transcriptase domain-containing protein [Candidatus Harrisonbacteria bacterium]|nr:reverse transcriptase domain-containing protein [Candidatus Harrisonbacteria bacterium]